MPRAARRVIFQLIVCIGLIAAVEPDDLRKEAIQLAQQRNWAEAHKCFERLLIGDLAGHGVAKDFTDAVEQLRRLNRLDEYDEFRDAVLERHPDDWRLANGVVSTLVGSVATWGRLVDGSFHRGQHGEGQWVDVTERDRALALQILHRHSAAAEKAGSDQDAQRHWHLWQRALIRGGNGWWRLQHLSALDELPPYTRPAPHGGFDGAPAGADGKPIFYQVPADFASARSDGERWRWALQRAEAAGDSRWAMTQRATFAQNQWGVQTLAQSGIGFGRPASDDPAAPGPYDVRGLGDHETIARLATGISRFDLPEDYDYIAIGKRLRLSMLGRIFENRRQYGKAADFYRERGDKRRLAQVVDPWIRLEGGPAQVAGDPVEVELVFRNADAIECRARQVDLDELVAELDSTLASKPKQHPHWKMALSRLGERLVRHGDETLLKGDGLRWTESLEPLSDHRDTRHRLRTPIETAGAWLVEADTADGNTARALVWVTDTVLVQKPLSDGKSLYFVADARSGEPVPEASISGIGWRWEQKNHKQRGHFLRETFSATTDAQGIAIDQHDDKRQQLQWMLVARAPGGRLALLDQVGFWRQTWYHHTLNQRKGLVLTDRPIYRPGDDAHIKAWVAETTYSKEQDTLLAGQQLTLRIRDPQGEQRFEDSIRSDAFGGVALDWQVPEDARLGPWSVELVGLGAGHTLSFRVEEYRKPEFAVEIDAPDTAVTLGEAFTATIRADYLFGAPVSEGRVSYTVTRVAKDERWYAPRPWDWLYGNGYWWTHPDLTWYPGWRSWGCFAPHPWWGWRPQPRPEIIARNEVPLGADGSVAITVDTALAKSLHGDKSHDYRIVAEVTDGSRRVEVGSGSVIAAAEPFKVYTWVDRGFYRAGDEAVLQFTARSAGGVPVTGAARIELRRVEHGDGEPTEETVATWQAELTPGRFGSQRLVLAEPGQYRAVVTVTDGDDTSREGGYLLTVADSKGAKEGGVFRFNGLELLPDRPEYAPGETAQLLIGSSAASATVLLFERPSQGVYKQPKVLRLSDGQIEHPLAIVGEDRPNVFVEALVVHGGSVHSVVKELFVPPSKRVLEVEMTTPQAEYQPGEEAVITVQLKDQSGAPVVGSVALSFYDQALDLLAGGSNVPPIREHFWKWRREHRSNGRHSQHWGRGQLLKNGERGMRTLGVFGGLVEAKGREEFRDGVGFDRRERGAFMALGAGGTATGSFAARAAAPMASDAFAASEAVMEPDSEDGAGVAAVPLVEPVVRTDFADSAFWSGAITTDKDGRATVTVPMPENLTGWVARAWAMADGTRVGQDELEVVTVKNLMVRLQVPRFAVQKDEAVLTVNVHNHHDEAVEAQVDLKTLGEALEIIGNAQRSVSVPAQGQTRLDVRVRALVEGEAVVQASVRSRDEADAMELRFPVLVHGARRVEVASAVIEPDQDQVSMRFRIPEERRPEASELTLRWSPTVAGAVVDALPYLVDYPYGCTEQTLNRFVPTVIAQASLREMGIDLAAIKAKQTRLDAGRLGEKPRWVGRDSNPVFDEFAVASMVAQGVERLGNMQNSDGGWGWFSGHGEQSWPHTTATVVLGLEMAKRHGAAVDDTAIDRGVAWLGRWRKAQQKLLDAGELAEADRPRRYRLYANDMDAFVERVLSSTGRASTAMRTHLDRDRTRLSVQGVLHLGIAAFGRDKGLVDRVLRNVEQFVEEKDDNQTAWLRIEQSWWYWYGDPIETHAAYLELLTLTDPQGQRAARIAKYLVANRKMGGRWSSTRDTAYAIQALCRYVVASGELRGETEVVVEINGEERLRQTIGPDNLFTVDNQLRLVADALPAGDHQVVVRASGDGRLYVNGWSSVFTMEEPIPAAGLDLTVKRRVWRLTPVTDNSIQEGAQGQAVVAATERFEREAIADEGSIRSGDLLEVELLVEAANNYEYLLLEDPKAAGTESVSAHSGYDPMGSRAYVEFRDQRVAFFLRTLSRGEHSFRYRLRAEKPGSYHALPTRIEGMYAPELVGNANEWRVDIGDRID